MELNLETDRQDSRLCDYIDPTPTPPQNPDETTDLRAVISGNSNLRVGIQRNYTVTITDIDGNVVQWNDSYSWNVVSDFEVGQEVDDNTIKLLVDNEDYVSSLILLQIIKDGQTLTELEVMVIDSF